VDYCRFWNCIDELVATSELVIDRPRGSVHPRYTNFIYPFDYGFLLGTTSGDGQGIDLWVGSLQPRKVEGVICTVDLEKRDSEIKLLLGCARVEMDTIIQFHNSECFAGHLIVRDQEKK
jgi:inorganic pyrophosphatase